MSERRKPCIIDRAKCVDEEYGVYEINGEFFIFEQSAVGDAPTMLPGGTCLAESYVKEALAGEFTGWIRRKCAKCRWTTLVRVVPEG